jgi:hypothetical protein
MDIMPLVTLAPVFVSVTANGGGFQAVNLKVLGDMIFDTAATRTPFIGVPLTTGGFPAGGLQGNLGSQLITQSTGYTKIIGTPTLTLFGPPVAAQWPGGASFIAGTTLELLTPFYNAWSVASPPFGGVFFVAPYIALSGYIATSGTAWANFSTKPGDRRSDGVPDPPDRAERVRIRGNGSLRQEQLPPDGGRRSGVRRARTDHLGGVPVTSFLP